MVRTQATERLPAHFARLLPLYTGGTAQVHTASERQGWKALHWAMEVAPPRETLVLVSAIWMRRIQVQWLPGIADVPLVPLQTVLQAPWCLLAPRHKPLPDLAALQQWLSTFKRPVRLGVSDTLGMPEIWRQAMARKTGVLWGNVQFDEVMPALRALEVQDVDLLLLRCGDVYYQWRRSSPKADVDNLPAQVLASSSPTRLWQVPTFTRWQLPALTNGWLAWFVPASMPPERQALLAKALHAIMLRSDTLALIHQLQHVPLPLNRQASMEFVQRSLREIRILEEWLGETDAMLTEMNLIR